MGEQLPLFGRYRDSIADRFNAFDEANPHVWERFEERALFLIEKMGKTRHSADAILHSIRWDASVTTKGDDDFKINNDFAALYARKFAQRHEKHADFFQLRERRAA